MHTRGGVRGVMGFADMEPLGEISKNLSIKMIRTQNGVPP
jgi:hypothetical protein